MKLRTISCTFVCGAAMMLFAGQALSDGESAPTDNDLREAVEQAASPDKNHRNFKSVRGMYEQTIKWWRAPGSEPDESTSLADAEWILEQRFMQLQFKGKWLEKSFEAVLILGYDKAAEQYTAVWMDTLGTRTLFSRGTLDESGQAITVQGEYLDPGSGATIKTRAVMQLPDKKGETTVQVYRTTPDGTEYKFLDIVSTRKVVRGA